jgi:hypothetical protein
MRENNLIEIQIISSVDVWSVPTKGHHRSAHHMPINVSLRKMTLKGILKNIVLTVNRYYQGM